MHLVALRYFHEVAIRGSIRHAADRLQVSPSAVSRQIQRLEHDFGAPLIHRRSDGIRLTPAGEIVHQQATSLIRGLDNVRSLLDDLRGLRSGEISIWAIEGVVDSILGPVVASYHRAYPKITVNVTVAGTGRILEALERHEADIGITFNAPRRSDIRTIAAQPLPHLLIAAPGHLLAAKHVLSFAELQGCSVVVLDASFGVRQLLDRAAKANGVSFVHALSTNSIEMSKALARSGAAVTFLPMMCVERECRAGELRAIPIRDSLLASGRIEISVHRDVTESFAAGLFVRELETALRQKGAQPLPIRQRGVRKKALPRTRTAT